jgi:heme-degrading monooxygenase HmoA
MCPLHQQVLDRSVAMVLRITWGKLRAGSWDEFERTYRANVITKGKDLKGLRGRWLSQDTADKDTGFAVSLWDSPADMQAYEQSALYREIMAPLQPFFVGEYKTYRSEVKYTDIAAPAR